MSSTPQQQERRRQRRQRSTASAVATTAATVAVTYGTYRLAQWYWKEDDEEIDPNHKEEEEEGTERPLEEDLPSFFAEQRAGTGTGDETSSNRGANSSSNYSWLTTAAVGVANWLVDTSTAPTPQGSGCGSSGMSGNYAAPSPSTRSRPRLLTRRQQLVRCRYQTRVAFRTCFQTLRPIIESLTDTSRQTKELKALRRRRQTLIQQQQQQENGDVDIDIDIDTDADTNTNTSTLDHKQQERELRDLKRREEELWREILVGTTTRMMVSSYAYALLLLSLTVQLHWLASASASNSTEEQQQRQQQEAMLMRSHRYLLDEGAPLLVSTVRRSVEKVFFDDDDDEIDDEEEDFDETHAANNNNSNNNNNESSSRSCWKNPSSQFVTCEEIVQTFYQRLPRVLDDVGIGKGRRQRRRNWIRFVLPDEEAFDPMWDICRSPVWEDAQKQVLECLWHRILRDGGSINNNSENDNDSSYGWGKLFQSNEIINATDFHSDDRKKQQQQQRQPLVKVMAQFKKSASALFDDSTNHDDGNCTNVRGQTTPTTTTAGKLQTLPTVLELGDITFQ